MGTLVLTKEARIYNGKKTASLINGAGKTKVPIGAWAYFWAFRLVPLVYISVFVPVP